MSDKDRVEELETKLNAVLDNWHRLRLAAQSLDSWPEEYVGRPDITDEEFRIIRSKRRHALRAALNLGNEFLTAGNNTPPQG